MTTQMQFGRSRRSKQQLAISYHNAISCPSLHATFVSVDTIACDDACQKGNIWCLHGDVMTMSRLASNFARHCVTSVYVYEHVHGTE